MKAAPENHGQEIHAGQRFQFGRNWQAFLDQVDETVIQRAENSLLQALGVDRLDGITFLDAGCGSGLFSLVARRSGARVCSFDFDPESVACALELKRRFFADDEFWRIREGSVLDQSFLAELGQFDVVYCWGVLHHTGRMWSGLENVANLVGRSGKLFVALYNDQGRPSVRWKRIKKCYNRLPRPLRFLILWPAFVRLWGPTTVRDLCRGRPFGAWRDYSSQSRGMSPWRDVVDWVGGYPFEVARPEEVVAFCRARQFTVHYEKTCGQGRGCNEFVFAKTTGLEQ